MTILALRRMVREELSRRSVPQGGIVERPHGQFRTDSTAWGVLALCASAGDDDAIEQHRIRLVEEQGEDGRVAISRSHSDSFWPTSLAVLAWKHSAQCRAAQTRAIDFLTKTTGAHRPRLTNEAAGHDTMLRGWPWVRGAHSWIEPTSLAVIALAATGHGDHVRVREAIHMILDRQLPHGGWNYGNTLVFGQVLRPMPENTGVALAALAGHVEHKTIERSLVYLQGEIGAVRTPISLGWSLLGLAAWDRWPSNGMVLAERCLAAQSRYGEYETSALCLLAVAALSQVESCRSIFAPND